MDKEAASKLESGMFLSALVLAIALIIATDEISVSIEHNCEQPTTEGEA